MVYPQHFHLDRCHLVSLNMNTHSLCTDNVLFLRYVVLQPILRILTRTSNSALQSVLHALFLPTPFKVRPIVNPAGTAEGTDALPEEVLKPGALYSDCAVVQLTLPPVVVADTDDHGAGGGKAGEDGTGGVRIPDDGELGGELAGRLVWEAFEERLKVWEKENPPKAKDVRDGRSTPPNVDPESSATPLA